MLCPRKSSAENLKNVSGDWGPRGPSFGLPQHQKFLMKPAGPEAAMPAGRTFKNVWPADALSLLVFQNSTILGIAGCIFTRVCFGFLFSSRWFSWRVAPWPWAEQGWPLELVLDSSSEGT